MTADRISAICTDLYPSMVGHQRRWCLSCTPRRALSSEASRHRNFFSFGLFSVRLSELQHCGSLTLSHFTFVHHIKYYGIGTGGHGVVSGHLHHIAQLGKAKQAPILELKGGNGEGACFCSYSGVPCSSIGVGYIP